MGHDKPGKPGSMTGFLSLLTYEGWNLERLVSIKSEHVSARQPGHIYLILSRYAQFGSPRSVHRVVLTTHITSYHSPLALLATWT